MLFHGFKPHLYGLAASLLLVCNVQAASVAFDLPRQPLAQTLKQIAAKDGLTLLVDSKLIAGKSAPAIKGVFEPMDALCLALLDSGLSSRLDGNTVVIEASSRAAAAARSV